MRPSGSRWGEGELQTKEKLVHRKQTGLVKPFDAILHRSFTPPSPRMELCLAIFSFKSVKFPIVTEFSFYGQFARSSATQKSSKTNLVADRIQTPNLHLNDTICFSCFGHSIRTALLVLVVVVIFVLLENNNKQALPK